MSKDKTQISLVIPMFNEAESILHLLASIKDFTLEHPTYDFEVVLVDDGSKDASVQLAQSVTNLNLTIVLLDKNRGQQYALCAGLRVANGDYVITMDADGQHPTPMLEEFLENIQLGGYELIQAFQNSRTEGSRLKKVLSKLFWLFLPTRQLGIENSNLGDFRIMSRQLVNRINTYSDPKVIRFLVPQLSRKSLYLPFTALKRESGKSKYTFSKMLNLALESILQVSILPLRILAGVGALGFMMTCLYSAYVVFVYSQGETIPGWSSVILLSGFMGSINLLSICLVGEYISKIFLRTELKQPPYSTYKRAYGVSED